MGVGFDVFLAGFLDDVVQQFGAGRGFVPVEGLEVISDELFVEAGLAFAGGVEAGRPEAGGVGREYLVDQDEFAVE